MNYHSTIFSKYLGDEQLLQFVSDEALINKMLQFEMALAKAQATLSIIPQNIADEINTVLTQLKINPVDLAASTLQNGVPVITLFHLQKRNYQQMPKSICIMVLHRRMQWIPHRY